MHNVIARNEVTKQSRSKNEIASLPLVARNDGAVSQVLVTGGTGFLGSAAGEALKHAGYPHQLLDAQASGAGLRAIVESLAESERKDAVLIHLAGLSDAKIAQKEPGRALEEVLLLTLRTVDLCVEFGLAKCILVSSAMAYGPQPRQPVSEDAPLNPQGIYASAKAAAEMLARGRVSGKEISLEIVRPGNIIGPGMKEGTLVKQIIAQLSIPWPVTVQSLKPRRDYIHVQDVARALTQLIALAPDKDRVRVFNVGTGRGTSALELYRILAAAAGAASADPRETAHEDYRVFDLAIDSSRLREKTGWKPDISLEEAAQELVRNG